MNEQLFYQANWIPGWRGLDQGLFVKVPSEGRTFSD